MQVMCVRAGCPGAVQPGDRFCGVCGTPVQDVRRPRAGSPAGEEPFFSHEPQRRPRPLNSATRFLCAAAYLNRPFANRVIKELLATRSAVAPSVNFDVGPVLRHCLRARRNSLVRDLVLVVIVVLGLIIKTQPTVEFLIFALGLGLLFSLGRRRGGLMGTFVFAVAAAAGAVLVLGSIALLFGSLPSVPLGSHLEQGNLPVVSPNGYLAPSRPGLADSLIPFILLLAVAWSTEFVHLRTIFRTLTQELRRGAEPPADAVSGAAGERLAIVEGAQWGNITLHSGWSPFIGAGFQTEADWSIAIRLRRNRDPEEQPRNDDYDYVPVDPLDLHQRIRTRLQALNDPALPENERIGALTVTDRVVGSGLLGLDSPLFDAKLNTPYSHASPEAIRALIRHPQARLRYYQQVSVSDEGAAVTSHGRTVIESVDQEVAVSAFVYVAVEGRMFYLQFVLTALPPLDDSYRKIAVKYGASSIAPLVYALRGLFVSLVAAPFGIVTAFRVWRSERRSEKEYLSTIRRVERQYQSSLDIDFGSKISIREFATNRRFGRYIEKLDVEKYNMMISRLLLETVQQYLDDKNIDTSAFGTSAANIINRFGDVITISGNTGSIGNVGSRRTVHNSRNSPAGPGSPAGANPK